MKPRKYDEAMALLDDDEDSVTGLLTALVRSAPADTLGWSWREYETVRKSAVTIRESERAGDYTYDPLTRRLTKNAR